MFSLFKKMISGRHDSPAPHSEADQTAQPAAHPLIGRVLSDFAFLQKQYGFELTKNLFRKDIAEINYTKGERQVYIRLNFADAKLIFAVLIGKETQYKTHLDTDYVKDFYWLFKRHRPELDWKDLHPEHIDHWGAAIEKNAALLRQYGEDILLGEKWSGKDSFTLPS